VPYIERQHCEGYNLDVTRPDRSASGLVILTQAARDALLEQAVFTAP
jgi:hypothetical protein